MIEYAFPLRPLFQRFNFFIVFFLHDFIKLRLDDIYRNIQGVSNLSPLSGPIDRTLSKMDDFPVKYTSNLTIEVREEVHLIGNLFVRVE